MRRLFPFTLFLGLALLAAGEAEAQCSCSPTYTNITPHREFELADLVFVGKVVELTKTDHDKEKDSYVETVKFEVTKAWKQDVEAAVVIRNKVQGCLNGFEKDEEWLVYAYRQEDGTLGTGCCCSRTNVLSKASKDLQEFEEKGERPAQVKRPLR